MICGTHIRKAIMFSIPERVSPVVTIKDPPFLLRLAHAVANLLFAFFNLFLLWVGPQSSSKRQAFWWLHKWHPWPPKCLLFLTSYVIFQWAHLKHDTGESEGSCSSVGWECCQCAEGERESVRENHGMNQHLCLGYLFRWYLGRNQKQVFAFRSKSS